MPTTDKTAKIVLNSLAALAILCCCALMVPSVQAIIIETGNRLIPGRNWNSVAWASNIFAFSLAASICLGVYFISQLKPLPSFFEKYGDKIRIVVFTTIIAIGILVKIVLYAKCRSLWLDEALLAENIVSRNWSELIASPLINGQSAPILYVIAVKAICSVWGYSEFSLRSFSFILFIGLLICEMVLLRKHLRFDVTKTLFILTIIAVLPMYNYYSNELKPYMGDAFFVVLAILLYGFYTQKKMSLATLTFFYLLILGFCSPSIFFIGGIMTTEFVAAVFAKNKKDIISVSVSGVLIVALFYLYFRWWMSSVVGFMVGSWGDYAAKRSAVAAIAAIFSPGLVSGNASVWVFVPFALRGVYLMIKGKDKIAYSTALSVLLAFSASFIGMWPLIGRLWLFLPAIVLTFSFVGLNFDSKGAKRITDTVGFCLYSIIAVYYTILCMEKIKNGIYLDKQEVNPLISYIKDHIKNDENLYVYSPAQYALRFKNGYTTTKIGNVDRDNIIYGINTDEWKDSARGAELDTVINSRKAYLLFQHHHAGIKPGLTVLQKYGTVTEVLNSHDTPLLYFEAYP